MTAARQQRKRYRAGDRAVGGLAGILVGVLATLALVSHAAATERIVVDRHTGLAIGGYDPGPEVERTVTHLMAGMGSFGTLVLLANIIWGYNIFKTAKTARAYQ